MDEMRVAADLGGNLPGDAGGPVQHRVAHAGDDLIDAVIGGLDIDQLALGLIERQALRIDVQRQPRQGQPAEGGGLRRLGQGRAAGRHGLCQAPARGIDIPGAIRLARDAAGAFGFLDRGVRDAETAGEFPHGGGNLRHGKLRCGNLGRGNLGWGGLPRCRPESPGNPRLSAWLATWQPFFAAVASGLARHCSPQTIFAGRTQELKMRFIYLSK
jgi:hypothetical protein